MNQDVGLGCSKYSKKILFCSLEACYVLMKLK